MQCLYLGWSSTPGEEVRILLKKSSWYYLSFFDYIEDGLHGEQQPKQGVLGTLGCSEAWERGCSGIGARETGRWRGRTVTGIGLPGV